MFSHLVRRGAEYHSAFVSRPASIVGLESAEYFRAWESLWEGREIVVVHHARGDRGALAVSLGAHGASRDLPGAERKFREYAAVLERAAVHCATPDVLFLIAAGPTAGVLAWDLAERGAQALDIGHLTAAYDEFTQKALAMSRLLDHLVSPATRHRFLAAAGMAGTAPVPAGTGNGRATSAAGAARCSATATR